MGGLFLAISFSLDFCYRFFIIFVSISVFWISAPAFFISLRLFVIVLSNLFRLLSFALSFWLLRYINLSLRYHSHWTGFFRMSPPSMSAIRVIAIAIKMK